MKRLAIAAFIALETATNGWPGEVPRPAHWPGHRGPNSDGSAPAGSAFQGPQGATLAVAWRAAIGPGYSEVALADGRAVTLFSDGGQEVAAAFDAATGKELWRHAAGPVYKGHDGSFDGPIATPAIAGGRVFALFPRGALLALEASTGRRLWRSELTRDQGGEEPYYGYGASPLVAGGVLVVEVGGAKGRAVVGFDPGTGKKRWALGEDKVNYQSPVVLRVAGREQVVAVGDKKLFGIDPAEGRLLWEHTHGGAVAPISSESLVPVPAGEGRLFLKNRTDDTTMVKVVPRPDGSFAVETLWTKPVLRNTYVVPVYHEGFLYGVNGRTVLTCVDAATGELRWRSREPGEGFLLLVGGDLVVVTKERTLHVGPASPEGWKERARLELFKDLVWTAPSFGEGAVFARSLGEIARVEWRAGGPAAAAGSDVAGPRFARFLEEAAAASDKAAVVDRFLSEVTSFPLQEGERVVFLYRGPADDMGLAGDVVGERREDPMKRVPGTDLFWYETRLPPDARVSYEFVRNYEERIPDPRNPRKVPALRFMSGKPARVEVSSLAMPGWQEPAHLRQEPPESARGRLETLEIVAATGAKATVVVYLPAGYEAGTSRHPAAYVLGGDGARDLGLVPRSLDNLVGASVAPVIVVFVGAVEWGAKKPDSEEEGPAEAALLAREVVPAVDRRFRTRSEATSRAAVGAGFDAWTAAYAAFHFPDVFGMVATQSLTMLSSDETKLQKEVRTAAERPLRVYQDWGRYDLRGTREAWDMAEANRRFASFLGERGYQPLGGQANDGFGWASWRNRTDRVFEALFPAAPATQGIAPTTRLP